jgi:LL-diaminopimelate aminotransferase
MPLPQPSSNLDLIPPYLFAELDKKIDAAKAHGVDIISLGVGDPDLPTPQTIVAAMQHAVADASTHQYPAYNGSAPFRAACAGWMERRFGVKANLDTEILSLIGAKEGLAHLILAYIQPGDITLVPSPAYPVYRNYTLLCGGTPVTVPLKAENGFLPDLKAIDPAVADKAKLFFLNYPNNPIGAIVTPEFIEEVIAFCKKHNIILVHDNAYSEMTFDGYKAPSFLSYEGAKDVCVELFSFSKMFNMTGWRLGFAVGNPEVIAALGKIKNNTDSGVFTAIQQAGQVGLENSDALTADINIIYGARRTLFVKGLQELGWPIQAGAATFYLWVPVPAGFTSQQFATLLLEECGIVVPPGNGYGPEGEGFFRVALTQPEDRLTEALERMKAHGISYTMHLPLRCRPFSSGCWQ